MTDVTTIHQPVLLRDCVDLVAPALAKPARSRWIAPSASPGIPQRSSKQAPRPPDRHRPGHRGARARHETHGNGRPCRPFHARARGIRRLLPSAFRPSVDKVNAVFMDLGLSSLQIDETERGFSYSHDAPLDMRYGRDRSPSTAEQVLAEYSFADLVRIFRTYGEERFSKQIAREIVRRREPSR